MALADLLRYCTSIQNVNLRYNVIDVSGATALAKASTMCLHLQSLTLESNDMDIDPFELVAAHNPVYGNIIDLRLLTWNDGVFR